MSKRRSRPPNSPKTRHRESQAPQRAEASGGRAIAAAVDRDRTGPADSVRDELAALEAGWDELLS